MALLDFMPLFVSIQYSFSANFYHVMSGGKLRWTRDAVFDDVVGKAESSALAARVRHEFLPELFPDPNEPRPSCALGIGLATIPHFLYGAPALYLPNQDPWTGPVVGPGDDPVAAIPALDEAAVEERFQPVAAKYDELLDHFSKGKVSVSAPDLQAPMNLLFRLAGERIFHLMLKKKAVAHQLFDNITTTFINAHEYFKRLLTGRVVKTKFSVAECCSFLLSPGLVEEFCAVYDNAAAARLGPMNLHSCGESTKNLHAFKKFDIVSAEFGFGTDLSLARQLLVHPTLGPLEFSCRLEPKRMLSLRPATIVKDVEFILHGVKGGPATIRSVGVDVGTPRENLIAAVDRVNAYNEEKAGEE